MPDERVPHLTNNLVAHGGLMRCCLQTIENTPVNDEEGEVLPCAYCRSSMRLEGGIWKWAKDLYHKEQP